MRCGVSLLRRLQIERIDRHHLDRRDYAIALGTKIIVEIRR
jgi:hypothetical protein